MPFGLAGFITLSRPMYYTDVSSDPVFWPVIGFGLFLMVIGIFIMYRMVNFRV
jgi:tight adherence protein B